VIVSNLGKIPNEEIRVRNGMGFQYKGEKQVKGARKANTSEAAIEAEWKLLEDGTQLFVLEKESSEPTIFNVKENKKGSLIIDITEVDGSFQVTFAKKK
jgi:hypothetical protein